MAKKLQHPVFGELLHELGDSWEGKIEFTLFGDTQTISHYLYINSETGIKPFQITEFQRFQRRKKALSKEVEKSLFQHYQSVCGEIRDQMDIIDRDHPLIPVIRKTSEIVSLIELEGLINSYIEDRFGLLFQATWDPELGVGVAIHDGYVISVGTQDMIL